MYQTVFSTLFLGLLPVFTTSDLAALQTQQLFSQLTIAPVEQTVQIAEPLSASGILVVNQRSGQVLFEKKAHTMRPMASITKLMTALVIAENRDLNEIVVIPQGVEEIEGNKAYLTSQHRFTVGDLLSATIIGSGNDAAYALALFHSGSIDAFVAEMNDRAISLGLQNTSFANPIGFDDIEQYSTPQDIAWLTAFALKNPVLARRMGSRGRFIYSSEGEVLHVLHTHTLMHERTDVLAGKTGTTDAAKQCLTSLIEHNNQQYIVVLLHSDDRYSDLEKIMNAL